MREWRIGDKIIIPRYVPDWSLIEPYITIGKIYTIVEVNYSVVRILNNRGGTFDVGFNHFRSALNIDECIKLIQDALRSVI